jgi:hypothetical protein
MRRKDKLVTDPKLLYEVINKAEVCRLGLVDGSMPYIVPLNFGFDGTYLYFHSATEGRKIDILNNNNRVCVEFEQDVSLIKSGKPCDWSVSYFSVICNGTAELITDLDEKAYGLNQIIKHYQPDAEPYTFTEKELSRVAVYKVTFEDIIGKKSG